MTAQKTMDKDKKYYITNAEPMMYVSLTDVIGEIKFLDTPVGNIVHDCICAGKTITIKPYGYTEKDENGKIKSFSLVGFTIDH